MGVYAYNDESDINNKVNITVTDMHVGGNFIPFKHEVVTIPARQSEQYHCIWLTEAGNFEVLPQGQNPIALAKLVSAWGTLLTRTAPHPTELFRAIQTNEVFQFHGDYEFDDFSNPDGLTTNGVWVYRASHGAWPVGLASAVRFRLEARRIDGDNLAQINVLGGNHVVEGTTNEGNMGFRTQVKAFTKNNEPQASQDNIRMVIPPGSNEGLWAVLIGTGSKGYVAASGFELRPI